MILPQIPLISAQHDTRKPGFWIPSQLAFTARLVTSSDLSSVYVLWKLLSDTMGLLFWGL